MANEKMFATGVVKRIYVYPRQGDQAIGGLNGIRHVNALKALGLEGDRNALGTGTYSHVPNKSDPTRNVRHVTIMSCPDFREGNERLRKWKKREYQPFETRRNIFVTGNADIRNLIGKFLLLGNVHAHVVEEAVPCAIPEKETGKLNFIEAFHGLSGVRAEILNDGEICYGDHFCVLL